MRATQASRVFLLTLLVMSLPLVWLIIRMDQHTLHLLANAYHPIWADRVIPFATHLADGITGALVCLLVLLRYDIRAFLAITTAYAASSLVVQSLKRLLFADHFRPAEFLEAMPGLHLIEGVVLNHHFSFPSGHSTTAFTLCFSLAVIMGGKRTGLLFAMLAGLIAYTRVYLSQHFMEDVLAGAWLGSGIAWLVYRWTCLSGFSRKPWLERRLLQRPK